MYYSTPIKSDLLISPVHLTSFGIPQGSEFLSLAQFIIHTYLDTIASDPTFSSGGNPSRLEGKAGKNREESPRGRALQTCSMTLKCSMAAERSLFQKDRNLRV